MVAVSAFKGPVKPITGWLEVKGNRIRLELANGDSPVTDMLWTHYYAPNKIGEDTGNQGERDQREKDRPSANKWLSGRIDKFREKREHGRRCNKRHYPHRDAA